MKKYPIIYKIFKLPTLYFTSENEFEEFINFSKEINNKFLRFTHINFENSRLEIKFHKEYSNLLIEQDLGEEKDKIHTYFSSKGILFSPENVDKIQKTSSFIPLSHACVILTQNTFISEGQLDPLGKDMKTNIKSLGVNYMNEETDYLRM